MFSTILKHAIVSLLTIAIALPLTLWQPKTYYYTQVKVKPHKYRSTYQEIDQWVQFHSVYFNLDPKLVHAIIKVESNYDYFAVSSVGAQGLMQVMPFWTKEIHYYSNDLFDINTNIYFGCYILRYYLDKYKDINIALAAYNGSKGSPKYPELVNIARVNLKINNL